MVPGLRLRVPRASWSRDMHPNMKIELERKCGNSNSTDRWPVRSFFAWSHENFDQQYGVGSFDGLLEAAQYCGCRL